MAVADGATWVDVIARLRQPIGSVGGYPDLATWTAARQSVFDAIRAGDRDALAAAGATVIDGHIYTLAVPH
jgi:hypothetical protein